MEYIDEFMDGVSKAFDPILWLIAKTTHVVLFPFTYPFVLYHRRLQRIEYEENKRISARTEEVNRLCMEILNDDRRARDQIIRAGLVCRWYIGVGCEQLSGAGGRVALEDTGAARR